MDEAKTPVKDISDAQEIAALATDDLLVEEVSIDGMCGVY